MIDKTLRQKLGALYATVIYYQSTKATQMATSSYSVLNKNIYSLFLLNAIEFVFLNQKLRSEVLDNAHLMH